MDIQLKLIQLRKRAEHQQGCIVKTADRLLEEVLERYLTSMMSAFESAFNVLPRITEELVKLKDELQEDLKSFHHDKSKIATAYEDLAMEVADMTSAYESFAKMLQASEKPDKKALGESAEQPMEVEPGPKPETPQQAVIDSLWRRVKERHDKNKAEMGQFDKRINEREGRDLNIKGERKEMHARLVHARLMIHNASELFESLRQLADDLAELQTKILQLLEKPFPPTKAQ